MGEFALVTDGIDDELAAMRDEVKDAMIKIEEEASRGH